MDHYQLELVPGLFALTEVGFLFVNPLPSFGLLDTSDNRWTRFKTTIDRELDREYRCLAANQFAGLQQDAAPNEKIKVVFLARHGQVHLARAPVPSKRDLVTTRAITTPAPSSCVHYVAPTVHTHRCAAWSSSLAADK
jgi:hypothetical protein